MLLKQLAINSRNVGSGRIFRIKLCKGSAAVLFSELMRASLGDSDASGSVMATSIFIELICIVFTVHGETAQTVHIKIQCCEQSNDPSYRQDQ
jgi:hypothetical protein